MDFEDSYFSQLTVEACKAHMFSDASGVGYGGYIAKEAGKSMLGEVYRPLKQKKDHAFCFMSKPYR
jgi:hypothetical protein